MTLMTSTTRRYYPSPAAMAQDVGETIGTSPWWAVTQEMINRFAALTDDEQWVHVDEERATAGPFGATVAHGMLTLSLVPPMLGQILEVGGASMIVNRGIDRVRFKAPVIAGERIRTTAVLTAVTTRVLGFTELAFATSVEIESSGKDALTAQFRALAHAEPAAEQTPELGRVP